MTTRPRSFFTLLSLLALVLVAAAIPASAHEGEGEFAVEAREPRGPGFRYVVRLTWTNDGHAALDSTVTATAIAADGTPQTPVTLEPLDQDGRYAAVVPSPAGGPYTVRFTAVTPEATAELAQRPAPTTTTTTQPAPPTTDTPPAPSTTVAENDEAAAEAGTDDDQEDSGFSPVFFVVAIAAMALIAVPILLQRRRSRA